MRIAIVGTGLIGASVCARRSRVAATRSSAGTPTPTRSPPRSRARRSTPPARSRRRSRDAELVVVAAPIAALPAQVAGGARRSRATRPSRTSARRRRASSPLRRDRRASSAAIRSAAPSRAAPRTRAPASSRARRGSSRRSRTTDAGAPSRSCTASSPTLGATPVAIDADAHDRLVAMTSHVPHVLANIVANQTGETRVEGHEPLAHAGGSLRDMTRIAGANPRIWVDIFLDNAEAIRGALAEHRRRIEQVESALEQGDAGFLARWIGEASGEPPPHARARVPRPGRAAAAARARPRPPRRARRRSRRRSAPSGSTSRTSSCTTSRPSAAARCTVLVEGEGEAQRAADAARERRATASSSRAVLDDVRIEPAASLEGHFAVPGDKSISHRALLLGAISDGDTHVRGWGRSGDTESTLGAVRALGVEVDERGDELIVHGVGLRGLQPRRDRLRQRGHARAAGRRAARVPGRDVHADRRRVALGAADGARRRAAAPHGRADRDDRRPPAADDHRRAARADRLRAAGRERAGQVGGAARRARRDAGARP